MAWKGDFSAIFTGASGQMAVMSELLHRKCNAAIPHADVGMDVFAFRDDREEVARIQVKTAPGNHYKQGGGYHAKFAIPSVQLERTDNPPLFYALVVRLGEGWGNILLFGRGRLHQLWKEKGLGSPNKKSGDLELYIQFRPSLGEEEGKEGRKWKVKCGTLDLTDYLNAWESLPPLRPPVAIDVDQA